MAWAGGISWTHLVCCVYTLYVMDTNKYSYLRLRKIFVHMLSSWSVRVLCTRPELLKHISALKGLKRVLKSWTYVNIFKTQPGQSLWEGRKTYAWKPINIINPYDAFLALFFGDLLPATVGNSILGKITLWSDVALQNNVVWWTHCHSQNLKTTTQLKNQPIKIPKSYLFLVLN